ncbi:MAG: hypothetical protein U5L45_04020 [Saprospiraceae bacterium]|nr:hypothetical protein [Saprospiraceae bacterium]
MVRFSASPKNEHIPSLARAKRARDAKNAFSVMPIPQISSYKKYLVFYENFDYKTKIYNLC